MAFPQESSLFDGSRSKTLIYLPGTSGAADHSTIHKNRNVVQIKSSSLRNRVPWTEAIGPLLDTVSSSIENGKKNVWLYIVLNYCVGKVS